jgi:hypothetical protein
MRVPSLDEFRHQSGVPPALSLSVDVRDADFTLTIPDSWPDIYALWSVTFFWREASEHSPRFRSPSAMAYRSR